MEERRIFSSDPKPKEVSVYSPPLKEVVRKKLIPKNVLETSKKINRYILLF